MNRDYKNSGLGAEVRAASDGRKKYLIGYAAMYDRMSHLINENGEIFREILRPGCFDNVLSKSPDVILNVGHDNHKLLARTTSGTLELKSDNQGLFFKALVPNTVLGDEIYELVKRGDHNQCSFVFYMDGSKGSEKWSRYEGEALREIYRVAGLRDVSIVTFAAYPATSVKARNKTLLEVLEGERSALESHRKNKLAVLAMYQQIRSYKRSNFIKQIA